MTIPDKLISYKIYNESKEMLGIAEITLPELSFMSESLKGAGIAGEMELPTLGHFQSFTFTINWNVIESENIKLLAPKTYHFDCRGSRQSHDTGTGIIQEGPIKILLRGIPKKVSLGKLDPAAKTDTSAEFEAVYIKIWIDEKEVVEIDKFNFICKINGVDYLEKVRKNLGM